MTYLEAICTCDHIDSESVSLDEKLSAVEKILSMATINAVKKDTLLKIVRWFYDNCVEVECDEVEKPPEDHQEYYQGFCSRCGRPVIAKKEDAFLWPGGTKDDHLCISCDVCSGLAEVYAGKVEL